MKNRKEIEKEYARQQITARDLIALVRAEEFVKEANAYLKEIR